MKYFSNTPIAFRYIVLAAVLLASMFLAQSYVQHFAWSEMEETKPFNWWRETPVPFLNYIFWALLSPLVYWFMLRYPVRRRALPLSFLRTVLFALAISTLHEVVTSTAYYSILYTQGEWAWSKKYMEWGINALPPAIMTRFLEYWVLFGVLKALMFYRKFHEKQFELISMENELNNAHLIALKKQMQPHFLFNTLNTVSALMDENVDGSRKVLTKLAGLLRIILERDQKNKITLRAEMEYVRSYLDIEHIRFSDRLKVEYKIADDTQEALVPSLILQPLVENAIQHGISHKRSEGHVIVSSEKRGELLELNVMDNGNAGVDTAQVMNFPGIGIKNVQDRLVLMYPGEVRFQLLNKDPKGTIARIVLPFETHKNNPT